MSDFGPIALGIILILKYVLLYFLIPTLELGFNISTLESNLLHQLYALFAMCG